MITIDSESARIAAPVERIGKTINRKFYYPVEVSQFEKELLQCGHSGDHLLAAMTAYQKAQTYGIPYSSEVLTVLPADYYQVQHTKIAGEFGGMKFEAEREA